MRLFIRVLIVIVGGTVKGTLRGMVGETVKGTVGGRVKGTVGGTVKGTVDGTLGGRELLGQKILSAEAQPK